MNITSPDIGVIEGFYGPIWNFESRKAFLKHIQKLGYRFYIYAPKLDHHLRKHWTVNWHQDLLDSLKEIRTYCRELGINFGIGLSPLGLHEDGSKESLSALRSRVTEIESTLSPDIFCLLFDDMRGDIPELAKRQVSLAHEGFSCTRAKQKVLCPTYYSYDPILSSIFGEMPERYLETIGSDLSPEIDVFWTGEHICSSSYPAPHLANITEKLRRKPFLWDNYPVNDDKKMAPFLHLNPFYNRPPELSDSLSAHAVNPMQQAFLSLLPLYSLPISYKLGEAYSPEEVLQQGVKYLLTKPLQEVFLKYWNKWTSVGLEQISEGEKGLMKNELAPYAEDPFAFETIAWLDGYYAYRADMHAETQAPQ